MKKSLSPENQRLREKIFIKGIAVVSADGFIAKSDESGTTWASIADQAHFKKVLQEPALFVMGRKTFESTKSKGQRRKRLVFSRSKMNLSGETQFLALSEQADDSEIKSLLNLLINEAARYHGQILILGGAEIYTLFLTIFGYDAFDLSIETNKVFGAGQKIFAGEDRPPESILINNLISNKINLGQHTLLMQHR